MGKNENEVHLVIEELDRLGIAAKMTQAEIAVELGYVSGSSVSSFVIGNSSPRLDTVEAWASLFGRRVTLSEEASAKTQTAKAQAPSDAVSVQLTPYQIALVTSELVRQATDLHNTGRSSRMVKDLDAIVTVLDRAVGR